MKNVLKVREDKDGQVDYSDYGPDNHDSLIADITADLTRAGVKKLVIYPGVSLGFMTHQP